MNIEATDADRRMVEPIMEVARTSDLPEWALTMLRGRAALLVAMARTEGGTEVVAYLQERRAASLRALRAAPDTNADYWRWQGHAELSRQLLERLGAEVPQ